MSLSDPTRQGGHWQTPGPILEPAVVIDWWACQNPSRSAGSRVLSSPNNRGEQTREERSTILPSRPIGPADELDEHSIAQLQRFFELLDRWEREWVQPPGAERENGDGDEGRS